MNYQFGLAATTLALETRRETLLMFKSKGSITIRINLCSVINNVRFDFAVARKNLAFQNLSMSELL